MCNHYIYTTHHLHGYIHYIVMFLDFVGTLNTQAVLLHNNHSSVFILAIKRRKKNALISVVGHKWLNIKGIPTKLLPQIFLLFKCEFLCIIFVNSKYKCDVDLKHVADQNNKGLIYPWKIYLWWQDFREPCKIMSVHSVWISNSVSFTGRTGVIIACYLVYTNRMSGSEAIHYVRSQR